MVKIIVAVPTEFFRAFCKLFGIENLYDVGGGGSEIRLRVCAEICAECLCYGCDDVDMTIRHWMSYYREVFDYERYNMRWVREKCCEAIMQYPDNDLRMNYLRYMRDSGYVEGLDEFRPELKL